MTPHQSAPGLDATVHAARASLDEKGVAAPDVLLWMATGEAGLGDELRHARELPLGETLGLPSPWDAGNLITGELGGLTLWVIEDRSGDPLPCEGDPRPWIGGLPVWLAAASGARLCVHTSAGSLLAPVPEIQPGRERGALAVVRDHLNLSGSSPLLGLGPSALGPLFPDPSGLHHLGLRRAALDRAREVGLRAFEAVAACTVGPALETPAERRMLATLGADVAVSSLATPYLAAAHAGVALLGLVAVADDGSSTEVASLIETARAVQPRLGDLLTALAHDLAGAVRGLVEEEG